MWWSRGPLGVSILVVLLMQLPLEVVADWPQFHRSSNRSGALINAHTSVLANANNVLQVRWDFATTASVFSSPVVSNKKLFIGNDYGQVFAIDSNNGTLCFPPIILLVMVRFTECVGASLWNSSTALDPTKAVEGAPAVTDDGKVVVYGTLGKTLHALHTADGSHVWTTALEGKVPGSPLIAGGVVYVAAGKTMQAVNLTDGAPTGFDKYVADGIIGGVAAVQGLLVFGDDTGKVVCLNICK